MCARAFITVGDVRQKIIEMHRVVQIPLRRTSYSCCAYGTIYSIQMIKQFTSPCFITLCRILRETLTSNFVLLYRGCMLYALFIF
jgi:hypothetical protein